MSNEASNTPKEKKPQTSQFGTTVLDREVAQNTTNDWLDFKKVKQSKRENFEENIEEMTNAFQTGQLVLNDDKTITMHLIFPKETKTITIDTLTFKPRITQADKRPYMKKVKSGDIRSNFVAIGCALTGQGSGIIESLDTEDFELVSTIALFFF